MSSEVKPAAKASPWVWVWVVLAAFCTAGAAKDGIWVAVIFFPVSALLVVPPLRQAVNNAGLTGSKPKIASIVAALIAFAAVGVVGAAEQRAEDGAKGRSATKQGAAPAPKAAGPSDAAKADMLTLWNTLLSTVGPCDRANSSAADLVNDVGRNRASVFEAYAQATSAQRTCQQTWTRLNDLDVPGSINGDAEDKLEETLERCQLGYYRRKESLGIMMEVLDGDQRPSKVQQFRDEAEGAQAGVLLCVAGMIQAGGMLGVQLPTTPSGGNGRR